MNLINNNFGLGQQLQLFSSTLSRGITKPNISGREIIMDSNKYIGDICPYGHKYKNTLQSIRYKYNDQCVECRKISDAEHYQKNKKKIYESRKKYISENKDKVNEAARKSYKKRCNKIPKINKEIILFNRISRKKYVNRLYQKKHREERSKRVAERIRNSPRLRVNNSMGSGIYAAIKKNKNGKHWESFVDYTLSELILHLEKLFTDGMTWDNYGEWHIDHKIPKVSFNYTNTKDSEFKKCWALENLQPLWAEDNLSKGATI